MKLDPEERVIGSFDSFYPLMPELISCRIQTSKSKEAIIARSQSGTPVMAFESKQQASEWKKLHPDHNVNFYFQIISEEQIIIK